MTQLGGSGQGDFAASLPSQLHGGSEGYRVTIRANSGLATPSTSA
jgi:hypothetical protein